LSGSGHRTAWSSFEIDAPIYIPVVDVAMTTISRRFEKLAVKARECEEIHSTVCEMFESYTKFFEDLTKNPQLSS
jgi:chromopyrrolic acid synthase